MAGARTSPADRRPVTEIDSRALELAAGTSAVMQEHLVECRNRYVALDAKLEKLGAMLFRGVVALVSLLLMILGYLLTHGGVNLVH